MKNSYLIQEKKTTPIKLYIIDRQYFIFIIKGTSTKENFHQFSINTQLKNTITFYHKKRTPI